MRPRVWLLAVCVSLAGGTASAQELFSSDAVVELTLSAPLNDLFARKASDAAVSGTLSYRGPDGRDVVIDDVKVSVRGNTSRQENECSFPKLKLRVEPSEARETSIFRHVGVVKIGTHCGESSGETLTAKFGRLPNEHSPHREAFVYRILDLLGVTTLRARPARIIYRDTSTEEAAAEPVTRDALLVEDDAEAMKRLGAAKTIPMERFTSAQQAFAQPDTIAVAFAEALAGNFDWCLKFTPTDTYRCDARKPLWNILALARADGTMRPLVYDFDLSGMVTGRHLWFHDIFNRAFSANGSEAAVEVAAQLQHTRSLFPRADLDAARRRFASKKADVYRALDEAPIDEPGKRQIRGYLDPFFDAMDRDEAFYLPVVVRPTPARADASGAEACARGGPVPVGTPVSAPLARRGSMVRVTLVDALWHFTGSATCAAILKGPVWLDRAALDTNYPPDGAGSQ